LSSTFGEKVETRLVREEQLKVFDGKLPNLPTVHFKMVMVGEKTLTKHDHNPVAVCDEVAQQPGFYLIGESVEALRDAMHDLVERFIAKGKEHESENNSKEQEESN